MCRIQLSTTAYDSKELYLNTLILNQRDKPFTEGYIVSVVEPEGIDTSSVKDALQRLVRKGLVTRSADKFYVRSISRKRKLKTF